MKKHIQVSTFKNEAAEQKYWAKFDLSKHAVPKDLVSVAFPRLKPSSHSISLRLPDFLLARLKEQAHELNIPYQSLIKQYIAKGVKQRA